MVAANAPANSGNTGSHGQSRIIASGGNVLDIKPGKLARPLQGIMGGWWKQGVARMLSERRRPLD